MYSNMVKFPTYEKNGDVITPTGVMLVGANGNFELKGAHTAGKSYTCVGAYITAYAN